MKSSGDIGLIRVKKRASTKHIFTIFFRGNNKKLLWNCQNCSKLKISEISLYIQKV